MHTMLAHPSVSSLPLQQTRQHKAPQREVRANLFKNVKGGNTSEQDRVSGGKDFAKGPPKKPAPKKEQRDDGGGGLAGIVSALDFAAPRSKSDARILQDTKDNWKSGTSKMSREEYAALRRKIGGTYKDYFKDYIEEDVFDKTYTKKGGDTGGTVPYLPLLVGVVFALLATTAIVVSKTS